MSKPQISLAQWFQSASRVLPWRDEPTPYRVWISEIMLQQTQVVAVLPFFERFMARFPTLEDLARAPESAVLEAWAGLGYYSRARNLHRAAQQIQAKGGTASGFPLDRAGWESLPGVGPYTAGAILSIAFGAVEAIVDGNVERVLARYFGLKRRELGESPYRAELWRRAEEWVRASHAARVSPSTCNQALMELGALTCSPRQAQCGRCPLRETCVALATHQVTELPQKKAPKQWITVQEQAVLLVNPRGEILMRLAQSGEWRAGLWDLPLLPRQELEPLLGSSVELGTVDSRAVVTRHKISRTTRVVRLKHTPTLSGSEWQWCAEPPAAVGSAFKKTWRAVRETFPGVALRTAAPAEESSRSH